MLAVPQKTAGPRVSLERVIGHSTGHNAAFCINSITGDVLYAAGCIVVVYNPRQNKQVHFFRARQPVCALAVSRDGTRVAAGQRGKAASITVWNLAAHCLVWENLAHHVAGVAALAFSPDGRYLVSCGFHADRSQALAVWEMSSGRRVAYGRLSQKVAAITFSEDGGFVTAGERHLKFWQLRDVDAAVLQQRKESASITAHESGSGGVLPSPQPAAITSKPAVMRESGPQFENFVDVCCGRSARTAHLTFALSSAGILCAFDADRMMTLWVNTRVRAGFALDAAAGRLFVGGADGIVRIFHPETLEFLSTLPLPAAVGRLNVTVGEAVPPPLPTDVFPGAVALRTAGGGSHVAVIYGDRSIFVWDCTDLERVFKFRSSCGHSGAVAGIAVVPLGGSGGGGSPSIHPPLPAGSFVTCSADATVRVWNLNPRATSASAAAPAAAPPAPRPRNLYAREQLFVIYIDEKPGEPAVADDPSSSGSGGPSSSGFPAGSWPTRSVVNSTQDLEVAGGLVPPSALLDTGLRCVAVSPGGDQVAAGDRLGGLRVFELPSGRPRWACAAHSQEVLCIKYTPLHPPSPSPSLPALPDGIDGALPPAIPPPRLLLASGSHDKTLKMFLENPFDGSHAFEPAAMISGDEGGGGHAAAVAAFVFSPDGHQLVSAGSDASLISSRLTLAATPAVGQPLVSVSCARSTRTSHGRIYDIAGDAAGRNLVVAGPDRRVHVYAQRTCKLVRSFKSQADVAELNRVVLDPTGLFVAAAAFDRRVHVFDFYSGEPVCHLSGHSELVTGLAFTLDLKRLITVSGDGCIMVWRLGSQITRAMTDRWAEIAGPRAPRKVIAPPLAAEPAAQFGGGLEAVVAGGEGGPMPPPHSSADTLEPETADGAAATQHSTERDDATVTSAPAALSMATPPSCTVLPDWAALLPVSEGTAAATAGIPTRTAAPPPPPSLVAGQADPVRLQSRWAHVLPVSSNDAGVSGVSAATASAAPGAARSDGALSSPVSEHGESAAAAELAGALATRGSLTVSEDGDFETDDEENGGGVPPEDTEFDADDALAVAEEEYPPDFHQPVEDTPATVHSFSVTRSAVFASPPLQLAPPPTLPQQTMPAGRTAAPVLQSPLGTACLPLKATLSDDSIGAVLVGRAVPSEPLAFSVSQSAVLSEDSGAASARAAPPDAPRVTTSASSTAAVPIAAFSSAIERLELSILEVTGLHQALSTTLRGTAGLQSLDVSSCSTTIGAGLELLGSAGGTAAPPTALLARSFLDSTAKAAQAGAASGTVGGSLSGAPGSALAPAVSPAAVAAPAEVLAALRAALGQASAMLASLAAGGGPPE